MQWSQTADDYELHRNAHTKSDTDSDNTDNEQTCAPTSSCHRVLKYGQSYVDTLGSPIVGSPMVGSPLIGSPLRKINCTSMNAPVSPFHGSHCGDVKTVGVLVREIMEEIFSFMDQNDLFNIALVCARWYRVVNSHSVLNALRLLRPQHCCIRPSTHNEKIVWYSTIADALEAAAPGQEIWIGKGEYGESLQLHKSVILRNFGNPRDVIIDMPATSFLDVKRGSPVLINLTLGSDNGKEFSCILVSGGSPTFIGCTIQMLYLLGGEGSRVTQCRIQHLSIQNEGVSYITSNEFTGSRFAAICVTGTETYPTLTGNIIKGGELMAVLLEDCKGARMSNNSIMNVKQCGVEAIGTKNFNFCNNIVRDCGSYGVYVRSNSFAVISKNTICKCKSAAICLDKSSGFVSENTVAHVSSSAIHAYYCHNASIVGNCIMRTGHSSVILDGCSHLLFESNTVETEEALAVLIIKGRDVSVSGNSINSSGSNVVIENSSPRINENFINNGSIGILIYGNSKPLVENNEVTNHEDAGVDILVGSSPVLRRNRIHDNTGSGIAISEVINFVDRCDFEERSRDSLIKNGLPLLMMNDICDNTLMAINSKGFLFAELGNTCRNNNNYVPESIRRCVSEGRCTYQTTRDEYVPQYWHPSVDDRNVGICETCYRRGHFTVMGRLRKFLPTAVLSRFYCDCDCAQHPPTCEEAHEAAALYDTATLTEIDDNDDRLSTPHQMDMDCHVSTHSTAAKSIDLFSSQSHCSVEDEVHDEATSSHGSDAGTFTTPSTPDPTTPLTHDTSVGMEALLYIGHVPPASPAVLSTFHYPPTPWYVQWQPTTHNYYSSHTPHSTTSAAPSAHAGIIGQTTPHGSSMHGSQVHGVHPIPQVMNGMIGTVSHPGINASAIQQQLQPQQQHEQQLPSLTHVA